MGAGAQWGRPRSKEGAAAPEAEVGDGSVLSAHNGREEAPRLAMVEEPKERGGQGEPAPVVPSQMG